MERLTENKELQNVRKFITLNSVNKTMIHKMFNDVFDKLAIYEKVKAEGRLHIAPCADSTPIWWVSSFEWFNDGKPFIQTGEYCCGLTNGELGKDWFLTKEEADTALQCMEQGLSGKDTQSALEFVRHAQSRDEAEQALERVE